MALIPDLPAASSLSNTDLLVIDTGSATKKIQAQDAGASVNNAGLVTTGAQNIKGAKTFLDRAVLCGSPRYAGASLAGTDGTNVATRIGLEYIDTGNATYDKATQARWCVDVYSNDSNNNIIGYYEMYRLPAVDANRASNATYDILTTKDIYAKDITSQVTLNSQKFSQGTLKVIQYGKIVMVSINNALPTATGNNQTGFLTGLPAAAAQFDVNPSGSSAQTTAQVRSSGTCFWMSGNSTSLDGHIGSTSNALWLSFTYISV